ncbi:MAG: hypothetical protein IJV39_02785 [Ruminococcus sp.]|nr:hypothetical protein [Ruminococcus sp.]
MKYILVAGIDGVGKTSLIGALKGLKIISNSGFDDETDDTNMIQYCLENKLTFTQETTLAGHRVEKPSVRHESKGMISLCSMSD